MYQYIVIQRPKMKYSGVDNSLVMVVDAKSAADALRQFTAITDKEYTKPVAVMLDKNHYYFI